MKILKFQNSVLESYITERAILRKGILYAGTTVTLTLDDNSQLADDDLIIIGKLGEPRTEKAQISAVVVEGSTIVIDANKHVHNTGVKVQKVLYDQVKIYHDTDSTGATKELLATVNISFDEEFTTYADGTNLVGYAFFSLYNSVTTDESDISIAIPYSSMDSSAKARIREFVKEFYTKNFSDTSFDLILETAQMELSAESSFKFKEKKWTLNTVVGQESYPFASYGLSDLGQVLMIKHDNKVMEMINAPMYSRLTQDLIISGIPSRAFIWGNELKLNPTPSEVKEIEIIGYKTLGALEEETEETAISIPAYLGFKILQDFWAGSDYKKSSYYGGRANQIKVALLKDNDKHFDQGSGFDNQSTPNRGLGGDFTIS